MSWSLKLFKIKNIDIKVHLTFILILVYAAYRWTVSTGEGLEGALFGIVATLLLFLSVILHELGHSWQALRFKIRVRNITLMPMGGVAEMEDIPEDPNKELRISSAGPLVNLAIAAVLIVAGIFLDTQSLLSLEGLKASLGKVSWSGMLAYLTTANLMLALFNLIPAFPMDGGRILRALLAKKLSYTQATEIATRVGKGFALLMGLGGILSGSWTLVVIAIFVYMGAGQENQNTQVKHTLGKTTVGQVMTREPVTLKANDSLVKAVELTLSTSQADFPVLEWGSNQTVGLLTQAELLRGLQTLGANAAVREVMKTQTPVTNPDEPLITAQQKMLKARSRTLLVQNSERDLVGLLTVDDINEAYRMLAISPALVSGSK